MIFDNTIFVYFIHAVLYFAMLHSKGAPNRVATQCVARTRQIIYFILYFILDLHAVMYVWFAVINKYVANCADNFEKFLPNRL